MLINITTGQLASDQVSKELSNFIEDGKMQSMTFFEQEEEKKSESSRDKKVCSHFWLIWGSQLDLKMQERL